MTTAETLPRRAQKQPETAPWRELIQSGAECTGIEAFALEHLIDLQRARAHKSGEGR